MNTKQAFLKSFASIKTSLPIMIGILLLVNLLGPFLEKNASNIFTGNLFFDPLIGALMGSISFGIPITSFIVGGELLSQGVSLVAVTAFVLAWSTVGVAMLPLEIVNLGRKFAITRNLICFVFAIVIAVLTVGTLNLINYL